MKFQVTTTITTLIDTATFEPEHSVVVEADPGIPESVAKAAAIGGCRALLQTLASEGAAAETEDQTETSNEGEDDVDDH